MMLHIMQSFLPSLQCSYLPGIKIYFKITTDNEEWEIYATSALLKCRLCCLKCYVSKVPCL